MKKREDKNTRYFMEVDLKEQKILGWNFGQKEILAEEMKKRSKNPCIHRIFLTKGQYNKLETKQSVVNGLTK